MKNLLRTALFALMALTMLPSVAYAQGQNPMTQPLPVDPDVRIGHLPNGLTYYIRHNEYPKGQADFYIAQKVGSALEEENQRGLAHFLEHMCFNGTTNFPDNLLRDWLESIGVKFGQNLNAYTSIDETVYNISNVPIARESVQDSCLLILHDWANDLTLDPKEIDKERGVIHQEWRRSMQGQMRIFERILPELLPTTKYGRRLPIGTMEVVDNFPPQALRDYYETWYRPDQQAVVVVGDIDVDRIENKIKEMFTSIEMPANAKPRTYEAVPDHKGTLFGIGSDPEQKQLVGQIMFLADPTPAELKNTMTYYINDYVRGMALSMLNNRLNDISSHPDAPFGGASVGYGDYIVTKTKDALSGTAVAKGNDIVVPLQAVYREMLRAARGGFTQSEYDRARNSLISSYESLYNNRATRENGTFVNEYVRNFIDGSPIPGLDIEWPLIQQLANITPLASINETFASMIKPDNRAIMVLAPEKEDTKIPTKEELTSALAAVDAEEITPFVDNFKMEPLITVAPRPGKIVSTKEDKVWGTTEWTLSNGAKVIIKPTKFKEDEISMVAQAFGGTAGYSKEYIPTLLMLSNIMGNMGLGSYNSSDLSKYLSGKVASVGVSFSSYSRSISGGSTPKDLPTMMELLYMVFTDINLDANEFAAMQKAVSAALANQEKNPQHVFSDKMVRTWYNSPYIKSVTPADVEAASREQALKIAKDLTANAADYTVVLVCNVDLNALKPLVETYIASLPGNPETAIKKVDKYNPELFIIPGSSIDSFTTEMTTPQTFAAIAEIGDMEYTTKNAQLASIAGQILTNRLIKTVREEMGAVYSIGASGSASRMGLNPITLSSSFPMKPEMKNEVLDFIKSQYKAMEKDITPEELNPIKEYMVKSFTESKEKNGAWLGAILGYQTNGVDTFNNNIETMNSITVQDVMNFMKVLNAQGNYRVLTLDPAK
ncbi:pitrilysin family protein [uncultured Duncaniella sp.]|uniref:M16 family metallopeptidase n=1 Tax=uncultured Duncaniella sp. TaxID=2768039 RepID=UPI002674CA96|nr:M16 family metallopeptidase [uncultured Duncaniella sp.]